MERRWAERLAHEVGRTGRRSLHAVVLLRARCQHHDRGGNELNAAAVRGEHLDSALPRKLHVEQDQVGFLRAGELDSLISSGGFDDRAAPATSAPSSFSRSG